MKRLFAWAALAGLVFAAPWVVRADEKSAAAGSESGSTKAWEWANFALLAGGLGYIIKKQAGPAYQARGRHIRKAMLEAEEIKKDADCRAAEVEQRVAGLAAEIAALRDEAQREEQAEYTRSAQRVAAEVAKVQARAEEEIAAAGKGAAAELKRHAAELALGLAEQKIRARMTAETEDRLVRGFLEKLHGPSSSAYAD